MGTKYRSKSFAILLCFALLAGMANIPLAQTAYAAPSTTDFFSSFESGDLQTVWENEVEKDSQGKAMSSNIDGNIRIPLIGNITDQVVNVTSLSVNSPTNERDINLKDGDSNTKWLTRANTGWAQYELSAPAVIVKYAMTSANDSKERDPVDWKVYGSADGKEWVELDARTGQTFATRFETHVYDFSNKTAYKYYKLDITKNRGDSLLQLADWLISDGVDRPVDSIPMKSYVSSGPSSLYNAKSNIGWTGLKAFTYTGSHTADGRAFSYNKIFDVDIAVTDNTELSYYIAPQFMDSESMDYSSTYAAVDLLFDDGTYLHELNAIDQHGVKLDAQSQGNSKTLYNNQWNFKKSQIGAVAAGKTIKRVLIAYDHPNAVKFAAFKGTIDDIKIDGNPVKKVYNKLSEYVDTRRGTLSNGSFSRGNNFPATAVPHGFNFWTPVTDAGGVWLYQYHESNDSTTNLPKLQALSLSHEPSPWIGERNTFQVMPSDTAGIPSANRSTRALTFKHENEIAQAHYYSVKFENGIRAEIAPTDHAAMFRFTFAGNSSNLILDNKNDDVSGATAAVTINADNTVQGWSDIKSGFSNGAQRMFFYAEFDKPVIEKGAPSGTGGGGNKQAYVKFDTTSDKVVHMKIATSYISVDQAKKNLALEIGAADTFDTIKGKAQEQWDKLFNIVQVEGATEDQLISLYSNMYRLYLWPNSAHENVGTAAAPVYKHANQSGSSTTGCSGSTATTACPGLIVDGKIYVNNGFWDTYRTTWPAYSLFTPTMAGELIDGFVQQYKDGGFISRWSAPGYANIMVGTSANVAFADAYLKGVTNFDVQAFYQSAIRDAATVPPNGNVGRKGMANSIFLGYTSTNALSSQALSWAMDGYINDYGIANLAKALADKNDAADPYNANYDDDYLYYINRAQNYVNMFNPNIEFFNGRNNEGEWRSAPDNYNPIEWGTDYTETNGWNMAFHAPQDGQGLANLYGGKAELVKKLDEFFTIPEPGSVSDSGGVIHEMREARDVRMGQYGHSNQPSHHIPYMYNYAGEPWKTQEKVREVLDRLYIGSEIGQGYAGDEDNGEMSAWYILSSLGIYPLKMGSPEYAIGSPLFKKATIQLENGKKIVINAPNNSKENKYVQGLKLNGADYTKTYIMHDDLKNGATLDFDMGPNPSAWGSGENDAPSSLTEGADQPKPLKDLTKGLIDKGKAVVKSDKITNSAELNKLFNDTSADFTRAAAKDVWYQYEFKIGPQKVEMYTLTSGTTAANDPKSWVLKGSNNGTDWTILDARNGETFAWSQMTRAFAIENPGEYEMYRVEVGNNGGANTEIRQIELLGYELNELVLSDKEAVDRTLAGLNLGDTSHVTDKLPVELPFVGAMETTITWSSSDPSILSNYGKIITRPGLNQPDRVITLTATVQKGSETGTKSFTVIVKAKTAAEEQYEAGVHFATGLEADQPQLTWETSTVASKNVAEFCCGIGGFESKSGTDAHSGKAGLLYSANATDATESYAYNQLFDVFFEVKPSSELSYWIYPEGPSTSNIWYDTHPRKTSQYVSLDLQFTDGTYLSDMTGAVDQHGVRIHPNDQGKSGKLNLDAWNEVKVDIGKVAAGKFVEKILISYNPSGTSGIARGTIDDIVISHEANIAAASLTGPDKVNAGDEFEVTYGIMVAGQEVMAEDVIFSYDADKLEFISANSAQEGLKIVGQSVSPGQVRLLAASIGGAAAADGAQLTLLFKAKESVQGAIANIAAASAVGDRKGMETELPAAAHQVQINSIDKSALNSLIAEAQAAHDAAQEGTGVGQYPAGSKAALQSAIDTARAVAADASATQELVEQAAIDLNAALQAFRNAVIQPLPGDLNGDGQISIGDLAIVAAAYGKRSTDPDWDRYKRADLVVDGVIDIEDLAMLARMILSL